MSGTASSPLTQVQADGVLAAVARNLGVVRTSPLRAAPDQLVTASLVPAAPLLDVSELVDGALNIAWTVKDVLYKDAKAVSVPAAGDLQGSDLVGAIENTGAVLGGEPFPPPLGAVGQPVVASATNIPGLLGQLFGELAVPRIRVRLELEWKLYYGGKQAVEGHDFIAGGGLTSPDIALLIPPVFDELRVDTIKTPHVELACLWAEVTLTLDSDAGPRQLSFDTPRVPILILPLLIPAMVVLFSDPNFGVTSDSWALVIVPEHSPLASARHLFRVLAKIEAAVDALSSIASLASWILGIGELTSAVTDHPRIRFINRDEISSFDDVSIKPGPLFGAFGDTNADDDARSILMLGPVGAKAWFFNNDNGDISDGVLGRQGAYSLTMTDELPYVYVRDLAQGDASQVGPTAIPADAVGDLVTDTYGDDNTWNASMSSFKYDPAWLKAIDEASTMPVVEPFPECPPPRKIGHPASPGTRARAT